jgi:SSS family solute:Na+ symporter
MSWIDWVIIIVLNGSIVVYALLRTRDNQTSCDWFLAGRTLPWWVVGLSLYATAIDSSDIVADSGGAYRHGMSLYVLNWVGTVAGWFLMAHFIALPMYRTGMYTNAEYLEARFGPVARGLSVLVQLQFRTLVLGIICQTLFLTLSIVCHWSDAFSWSVVVLIALIATVYTVAGGLRSVAITDALQSVIMVTASLVVFLFVWGEVGGWGGLETRLEAESEGLAARLLHIGADRVDARSVEGIPREEFDRLLLAGGEFVESEQVVVRRSPGWLVFISLVIAGLAYAVINHTQSMRLFGARSERDLKLSVALAGSVMIGITFLNLTVGGVGRALFPGLENADHVYPSVVRDFGVPGLKGIVVAGILAAALSTFDSIGSTISALITRDVYGRFIVKDRDDRHYVLVGRLLTPAIIFGSFLYVPILQREGMFDTWLEMASVFVVPLLTLYLMGIFTPVHRATGTVGLAAGMAYGVWSWIARGPALDEGIRLLPSPLLDGFTTAPASMIVTAASMLLVTLVTGRETRDALRFEESGAWLRESRRQLPVVEASNREIAPLLVGLGVVVLALALTAAFW